MVVGRGWPNGNPSLPNMCYSAEFGRSRSNGAGVMKEILLKILTTRIPPFKVTQGHRHRHRSICHIWVPISDHPVSEMTYTVSSGTLNPSVPYHSNHCLISHHFRHKRRFLSKIANYSQPVFLMPLLSGFPWEMTNVSDRQMDGRTGTSRQQTPRFHIVVSLYIPFDIEL